MAAARRRELRRRAMVHRTDHTASAHRHCRARRAALIAVHHAKHLFTRALSRPSILGLTDQVLANTTSRSEQTSGALVDPASHRQEDAMRKLALALAAAALLTALPASVSTVSAAPLTAQANTMTDVSSRHWRHWRHYGWRHRHYGWYHRRHYGWYPHHRYYGAYGYRPYY